MRVVGLRTQKGDRVKRTDQPMGQYKINPNPNTNTKYVLIRNITPYMLVRSLHLTPERSACCTLTIQYYYM